MQNLLESQVENYNHNSACDFSILSESLMDEANKNKWRPRQKCTEKINKDI